MNSCLISYCTCSILFWLLINVTQSREIGTEPVLIVISYDGFRNEYLQRNVTPNLLEFRRQGVYTDYMINVFPTKTFTNHHSIATGLYPEIHGVTANSIYDNKLNKSLGYGYEIFHYNRDILPIWTLNEKNGGTSGCMMWPGTNFEYSNITCTYTVKYNTSIPMKDRVDTVISWLKDTKNPPNLIMFYMETPDKLAHIVGPESSQITELLKELDAGSKYFQDELKKNNLAHRTNIIHLSDHGMDGVTSAYFINLTSFLGANLTVQFFGTSPVLQIVPEEGRVPHRLILWNSSKKNKNKTKSYLGGEKEVYIKLKNASIANGNFNVYKPETLPKQWHSSNAQRFGPIIAVANPGYAFQDMYDIAKYYEKVNHVPFLPNSPYGTHGYDNNNDKMHPIFMAKGPLFKREHKVEPFSTTDLYSLFANILNIKDVPPNNGTFNNVADLLVSIEMENTIGPGGIIGIVILVAILLAVIIYGLIYIKKKKSYFFVM